MTATKKRTGLPCVRCNSGIMHNTQHTPIFSLSLIVLWIVVFFSVHFLLVPWLVAHALASHHSLPCQHAISMWESRIQLDSIRGRHRRRRRCFIASDFVIVVDLLLLYALYFRLLIMDRFVHRQSCAHTPSSLCSLRALCLSEYFFSVGCLCRFFYSSLLLFCSLHRPHDAFRENTVTFASVR